MDAMARQKMEASGTKEAENQGDSHRNALAQNVQLTGSMRSAVLLTVLCLPASAWAQDQVSPPQISESAGSQIGDQVLVQEVMPELAGSELGIVPIAPAPPPGATLVIHRSDILRALARGGMQTKGLSVPRMSRVERKLVTISRDQLREPARQAVQDAVAPCVVGEVHVQGDARISEGPRALRVEFPRVERSGSVSGAVVVSAGAYQARVPVSAMVTCPAPEVTSGKQVTLFAKVGNVKASAPGEAKQNGRTGDVIRVINSATGAALRGRVVDAQNVEVLQ